MQTQGLYGLSVSAETGMRKASPIGLLRDKTGVPVFLLFLRDISSPLRMAVHSAEDILAKIHQSRGNADDKQAWQAVLSFFEAGGQNAHVLGLPVKEGKNLVTQMIGKDGGLEKRTGIYALQTYFDSADIVVVPQASQCLSETNHMAFYAKLLDLATQWKRFFVVVDFPKTMTTEEILKSIKKLNSPFAAAYYPWIVAPTFTVPPGAFVAAGFQLNDRQHNINDIPANRPIATSLLPLLDVSPTKVQETNAKGLNLIRRFSDSVKIWGGKTLADNSEENLRFISIARTLLAVRQATEEICEPFLFEPASQEVQYELNTALAALAVKAKHVFDSSAKTPYSAVTSLDKGKAGDFFRVDVSFGVPLALDQLSFALELAG